MPSGSSTMTRGGRFEPPAGFAGSAAAALLLDGFVSELRLAEACAGSAPVACMSLKVPAWGMAECGAAMIQCANALQIAG